MSPLGGILSERDKAGMKTTKGKWLYASSVAVALLAALASVIYAAVLRPQLLSARQIRNHAHCQTLQAWLRLYFEKNGRYPSELLDAVPAARRGQEWHLDAWDNRLHYESDGGMFLLISYGRDVKPDGGSAHALRALGDHPEGYDICGNYDADEVLSDVGWHRLCGK